jgi:monodehydroascorbate reductase (NADH)
MLILIFTVARLFTANIAEFYENYYKTRGVKFVKGNVLTSFEHDPSGKVDSQCIF